MTTVTVKWYLQTATVHAAYASWHSCQSVSRGARKCAEALCAVRTVADGVARYSIYYTRERLGDRAVSHGDTKKS